MQSEVIDADATHIELERRERCIQWIGYNDHVGEVRLYCFDDVTDKFRASYMARDRKASFKGQWITDLRRKELNCWYFRAEFLWRPDVGQGSRMVASFAKVAIASGHIGQMQ